MHGKFFGFLLSLLLILGLATVSLASKADPPEQGDGFKAVNLEEAKKLHADGVTVIAAHSHTTDFMNGRPPGTKHITCMVPSDHKSADLPLASVDFDLAQLPQDKNAAIMMYCESSS